MHQKIKEFTHLVYVLCIRFRLLSWMCEAAVLQTTRQQTKLFLPSTLRIGLGESSECVLSAPCVYACVRACVRANYEKDALQWQEAPGVLLGAVLKK